jgi:hypothetical protein
LRVGLWIFAGFVLAALSFIVLKTLANRKKDGKEHS